MRLLQKKAQFVHKWRHSSPDGRMHLSADGQTVRALHGEYNYAFRDGKAQAPGKCKSFWQSDVMRRSPSCHLYFFRKKTINSPGWTKTTLHGVNYH